MRDMSICITSAMAESIRGNVKKRFAYTIEAMPRAGETLSVLDYGVKSSGTFLTYADALRAARGMLHKIAGCAWCPELLMQDKGVRRYKAVRVERDHAGG